MKELLFLLVIFICSIVLSVILLPPSPEGFTTYFRQTIRPHIRNFKGARESFTQQFNTKFTDISSRFGFS
jgi:hypothetical protein